MKTRFWLTLVIVSCLSTSSFLPAQEEQKTPSAASSTFTPFTGKVTRSKVRLRTKPITGKETIWRELNKGDLFVIVNEDGDYYAVQPSKDIKGYIYRSYVIDGVVEGQRVNVRLAPDFDAPTMVQLNTGDRVGGEIVNDNRKWLEIDLPPKSYFYVMKDYIENIGDANLYAKMEAARENAEKILKKASQEGEDQLSKNYNEIDMVPIFAELDQVIALGDEKEDSVQQATNLKKQLNERLLLKKIEYYEKLGSNNPKQLEEQNKKLKEELVEQEKRLATMEGQIGSSSEKSADAVNPKMVAWQPVERRHFQIWADARIDTDPTIELFYEDQHANAQHLRGRVEIYESHVRNKPGDYFLINSITGSPIAYLYSTQVDLHHYLGRIVTIKAVERPNNHFAHPAYFVLEVE